MTSWLASLLLMLLQADPAGPAGVGADKGSFVLSVKERAVGAESFEFWSRGDSLVLTSRTFRTVRGASGDEQLEKQVAAHFSLSDYSLRYYQSNETFRGQTLVRGVIYQSGDTALTIYREQPERGGTADRLVAPPGRFFVLDSGVYAMFNLICKSLHGQTFTTRPLNLVTLGVPDTLVEAEVADLGRETIRWGAKPVQARKLSLTQGNVTFLAWMDPAGRLLRLTHDQTGLRVERQPPAVKRRSKSGG